MAGTQVEAGMPLVIFSARCGSTPVGSLNFAWAHYYLALATRYNY